MVIFRPVLMVLAWAALMLAAPAFAAAPARSPGPASQAANPPGGQARPPVSGFGAAMDARLDEDEARLRAIRLAARARAADDAALRVQIAAIGPVQADVADAISELTPRLESAKARLAELGPAPAAGQPPEDPDIVEARARLTRFRTNLEDSSKRARLLALEADQLSDNLARRLRENFSTRLWAHSRSIFDPTLWGDVFSGLPGDLQRATAALTAPDPRASTAGPGGAQEVWSAVLAALSFILLVPGRILLARLGKRWAVERIPNSGLRKSALTLWLVVLGALTAPVAALLLYSAVRGVLAVPPAVDALAHTAFAALLYAAVIAALGRNLLAPGRASWRLAPVTDAFAARLALFPALIGAAVAAASLMSEGSVTLNASSAVAEASLGLAVVIQILAVGAALAWARAAPAATENGAPGGSTLPWVLAAVAAWLTLAAAAFAVTIGYVALASFMMRELVWIATVLASLFLLMRFVDDLCDALFAPRHGLSRLIAAATGLSDLALEQIGVLLSGALRLGLMVMGWMAIVAPFGASAREVLTRATSAELVFRLGQITISPGLIFGGTVVFAAGLLITRVIRGWMETTYLPKTRIDVGLRTSITAGLTYLGALIALLMACAYLGLSLSKIALFASALSVGIGFGLQAVIGNFVSGLILLAERPVKVGDRIAIGDQEGDVQRINIRATEIEMGDRSKLIVPNSDLVSKVVRNITHGSALGQVKIVLRVAEDADATEVRKLILDQLVAHAGVLRDPAPAVYLTNVADGALEFTALATVGSPRLVFGIRSELLFAMVAELKTRDVKLASGAVVQPRGA